MMGESLVDSRVAPIYKRYNDVQTILRGRANPIQLVLARGLPGRSTARVDDLAGAIEDELEDAVYASKGESLEQIVGYYLQMRGATLAVAESCTGGLLAERITTMSGSSRYFWAARSCTRTNSRPNLPKCPPADCQARRGQPGGCGAWQRGFESAARQLWDSALPEWPDRTAELRKSRWDWFTGTRDRGGTEIEERKFPGDRKRVRWFASQMALDMVRRKLM